MLECRADDPSDALAVLEGEAVTECDEEGVVEVVDGQTVEQTLDAVNDGADLDQIAAGITSSVISAQKRMPKPNGWRTDAIS